MSKGGREGGREGGERRAALPRWLPLLLHRHVLPIPSGPILIAQLFEAVKWIHLVRDGKMHLDAASHVRLNTSIKAFVFDVLGIESARADAEDTGKLDGVLQLLIEMRNKARADKDFATSDQIRDALGSLGIQLKDGKEGTTYSF